MLTEILGKWAPGGTTFMKPKKTRPGVNCAEVSNPKQQQYRLVLVDTWWYWVSMEWYWLIYDGTGSVEGGCSWYLVVLGQ